MTKERLLANPICPYADYNESSNTFVPTYKLWGIEGINDALPIYIKVCRNVGAVNTYREYQRQIIGRIIRFENAETKDVCILFGGEKDKTLLDNLRSCYEWIYDVKHGTIRSRYEKIYIDVEGYGHYQLP